MKKRLICMLMTIVILLPMLAVTTIPSFATDSAAEGVQIESGDAYYSPKIFERTVHTIETSIYITSEDYTQAPGEIFGTYRNDAYPYMRVRISTHSSQEYFVPVIEYQTTYGGDVAGVKSCGLYSVHLEIGKWYHLAFVIDPINSRVQCYVDGVCTTSAAIDINGDILRDVFTFTHMTVGNDSRPGSHSFLGKIKNMAVFSDTRTPEEIAEDYEAVDVNSDGLMAYWEFVGRENDIEDKSGNGYDLRFSKEWLTEEEMDVIRSKAGTVTAENAAYAFAVVGDIQTMTEYDTATAGSVAPTNYVEQIHKWLADNASSLNIRYVIGVGDITEDNTDAEWDLVYPAISQLNGRVDYGLVRGDHDVRNVDGVTNRIDRYFGADDVYMAQFSGENGGVYETGSALNVYRLMTLNGVKWLFIHLDSYVTNEKIDSTGVLEWAKGLIESHPDHRVVITTHEYLDYMGVTQSRAEHLWNDIVSKYENVEMVFSGDISSNYVTMTQTKGEKGNTVSQFLIDPQHVDNYYLKISQLDTESTERNLPVGLITVFYFSADGKTVSAETYSPIHGKYYNTLNQFTFDLDADVNEKITDDSWTGAEIVPSGSGTVGDPYIIENGGNLVWMSNNVTVNATGTPSFDGAYFKQICDIDLNGKAFKSIGHYYGGSTDMAAFGGVYDGNGYAIKNGVIISNNKSHGQTQAYGDGMFGVIYGATIKNIVLEDIDIWSYSLTGGIVGRAASPLDGSAEANFNIISGCIVNDSVKIHPTICYDNRSVKNTEFDTDNYDGIVGAICGLAHSTTVSNCKSAVNIEIFGMQTGSKYASTQHFVTRTTVGGIVGAAGYDSVIEGCSFSGSINIAKNTGIRTNLALGGIVGLVTPNNGTTSAAAISSERGGLTVTSCCNTGTIGYTGDVAVTVPAYMGGIIGYAPMLTPVAADTEDIKAYCLENCYNAATLTAPENIAMAYVGGLVGYATVDGGSDTLWIENSASVLVGESSGSGNEYNTDGAVNNNGYSAVTADPATVITMTADEIAPYISDIVSMGHIHVGGTATCSTKALCELCGEEYGKYTAHEGFAFDSFVGLFVCTDCGDRCEHSLWSGGICADCGQVCVHDWSYEDGTSTCSVCENVCTSHSTLGFDFTCAICGYDKGISNSFSVGSKTISDKELILNKHHSFNLSFNATFGSSETKLNVKDESRNDNIYFSDTEDANNDSPYFNVITWINNVGKGNKYTTFASLWLDTDATKLYLTESNDNTAKICEIEVGVEYSFDFKIDLANGKYTIDICKGGEKYVSHSGSFTAVTDQLTNSQLRFGESAKAKKLHVQKLSYTDIEVGYPEYENSICVECGIECNHIFNAGGHCRFCGAFGNAITFDDGKNGGGNSGSNNGQPLTEENGVYCFQNGSHKQLWDYRDVNGELLGRNYVLSGVFNFSGWEYNSSNSSGTTRLMIWADGDVSNKTTKFALYLFGNNGKLELTPDNDSSSPRLTLETNTDYDIRVAVRSEEISEGVYSNVAYIIVDGELVWTRSFTLTAEDGISVRIGDHTPRKTQADYTVSADFGIRFIDSDINIIGTQQKENANYRWDPTFDIRFVFGIDDIYLSDVGVKVEASVKGGNMFDDASGELTLSSSETVLTDIMVNGKICQPGAYGAGYGGYYLALAVTDIPLDTSATYTFTLTPYVKHHGNTAELFGDTYKITATFENYEMKVLYDDIG